MDELTMFIIVATAYMVLTVDIHFVVILLAYFVSSLPLLFWVHFLLQWWPYFRWKICYVVDFVNCYVFHRHIQRLTTKESGIKFWIIAVTRDSVCSEFRHLL